MNEKKKTILLPVLAVGLISMTIVYASLSSTLNINGSARVQNIDSSWNIHFAHISNTNDEIKTYEYATTEGTLDLSDNNTTVTVPRVTLKAPGDKVEYRFKVVNEGDITGYINVLNNIGIGTITYGEGEQLTQEQKTAFQNDIQVTLTYYNPVAALAYNDVLAKNQEKELILTIQYIKRDTQQYLPTTDVTFTNITASITYGQDTTSLSGNGAAPGAPTVVQPQPAGQYSMASMCPGCVYARNTTQKYITSGLAINTVSDKYTPKLMLNISEDIYATPMEDEATTDEGLDPYTLTPEEYTSDYTSLGNRFLGYILADDGTYRIKRAFACGRNDEGEYFCLEGGIDESGLDNKPVYQKNVDILNHFFPGCNEDSGSCNANCFGSLMSGHALDSGDVMVREDGLGCSVNYNGNASCYS